MSLLDILKSGKGTGLELLKTGSQAIKAVAENIGNPRSSPNFSADSFHRQEPQEPDDPESVGQSREAPSEDPSKVDIKAPSFDRSPAPAVRLSGDDLVKNLEKLHQSIISYV